MLPHSLFYHITINSIQELYFDFPNQEHGLKVCNYAENTIS